MNDWVLAEQNHQFIASKQWDVAILPFGATEPHNLHMPYGTDNFQVEQVGRRSFEHTCADTVGDAYMRRAFDDDAVDPFGAEKVTE